MYLIDTNVWSERLLDQQKSEEVGRFLSCTPSSRLFLTDFSFHSLCVILAREDQAHVINSLVRDLFLEGDVRLVRLRPEATADTTDAMKDFRLDFDDAYQYVAAVRFELMLVSYDTDFDRCPLGRHTPRQLL